MATACVADNLFVRGGLEIPDPIEIPALAFPRERPDDVRLLSYNIQWGMGADGVRDLNRVVEQLRGIDADIVILNEVDVNWRRSGNEDQPQHIARPAGYKYSYFGAALTTWASGNTRLSRYGNLLLSRFPIVEARTVALPVGVGREPRSAIVAQLDIDGASWIVLGTHLGLHSGDRTEQVVRLRETATELAAGDLPVIIMGDFNARPQAPEISLLSGGALDPRGNATGATVDRTLHMVDTHLVAGVGAGHTFPFPEPYARIDYVFVSACLADAVVRAEALSLAGSDHLPVVVDVAPTQSCQFSPIGIR